MRILTSYHPNLLTIMSSDQCAQNPDGSLKDPKDIQWFNNVEDAWPLPFPAAPAHHQVEVFATRPQTCSQMLLLMKNLTLMRRTLMLSQNHLSASTLLMLSTFLAVPLSQLSLQVIHLRRARCKMVNLLFTLGFPVQTNTDRSFLVVLR